MELERKSLRIGTAVVVCAVVLRLLSGGALESLAQQLTRPEVASFLLFLETGRIVRLAEPQQPTEEALLQQEETAASPMPEDQAVQAVFAQEDASLVEVSSTLDYEADLESLIRQPLRWDLTQEGPTVLILHSHATESYEKTEDYTESSAYRTMDEGYNVVSIGDRLAQLLTAGGIEVIHDRTLHDYPSYNNAYNSAREAIERYLAEYPTISMVLDIHRDSRETEDGRQFASSVAVDGASCAQLMLVVGSDAGGLTHPNWSENMALAVKLHAQLEKNDPGICRPINLRSQRFNQDLSAGALLIEVGAAGNTRSEALLAAEQLAQGILDLAHGTE